MKKLNVAVLGATGLVGETIISLLKDSQIHINNLFPLASAGSKDHLVDFDGKSIPVEDANDFNFEDADLAFFAVNNEVAKQYADVAIKHNCWVIDNSSQFRYDDTVPLIIPEINGQELKKLKKCSLIANPNCSTIQMLIAVYPIYKKIGISRINVATYQAVSGTGKKAISELIYQTGELLNGRSIVSKVYPKQIAFNILPHIDDFLENGYTKEEMKMCWETRKILNDPKIEVNATAVRVPVISGHCEALHIEAKNEITLSALKALLRKSPAIKIVDQNLPYPTPMTHAMNNNFVHIGRIRKDLSRPKDINMWTVSDNIRKGAAWNAIQIAQILNNERLQK